MLTIPRDFALAISPVLLVGTLLAWAEWRDRRRAGTVACQIRLTDAMAAEFGPILAPVVTRRLGGSWRVQLTLPLGQAALVGRVLEITQRVLPEPWEIRVTPSAGPGDLWRRAEVPARRLRAA